MAVAWAEKYKGIPFKAGGLGRVGTFCWGLVVLVYGEQFRVALPTYLEEFDGLEDCERINRIIAREALSEDWRQVEAPQIGDVVVYRSGRARRHIGVVVGDGEMLHADDSVGSTIERWDRPGWAPRIIGFFRHAMIESCL